jgi:hypothetical protein
MQSRLAYTSAEACAVAGIRRTSLHRAFVLASFAPSNAVGEPWSCPTICAVGLRGCRQSSQGGAPVRPGLSAASLGCSRPPTNRNSPAASARAMQGILLPGVPRWPSAPFPGA